MTIQSLCLFFHPDGYTTARSDLMGRHVAGQSFLQGYLRYGSFDSLYVQVDNPKHVATFREFAHSLGRHEVVNVVERSSLHLLEQAGSAFYPGPGIDQWSLPRSSFGCDKWSLIGITHTTASQRVISAISSLVTSPVYPWDALICTSNAVKNNVLRILSTQCDFLKDRFNCKRFILPNLPVIPLGVHSENFARSDVNREVARNSLHIPKGYLVVLFVGRLSFHGKAHPAAMYQSVQAASILSKQNVIIIECGWYANDHIKESYVEAASVFAPNVERRFVDGRDPNLLQLCWRAADIFCSLSDNIQETFGITPIEAMASGLPVVVSDWNGYKDTVRDGVDGFRIPTLAPPPGYSLDLAYNHALEIDSYDMYCGYTSSLISIDIDSATSAFSKLFSSSDLRRSMGANGVQNVRDRYDWRIIIPQYDSLVKELSVLRSQSHNLTPLGKRIAPQYSDPFYSFAGYPTAKFLPSTVLVLSDASFELSRDRFQGYSCLSMINYTSRIFISDRLVYKVFQLLATAPLSCDQLADSLPELLSERFNLFRTLAWLLKLGILRKSL